MLELSEAAIAALLGRVCGRDVFAEPFAMAVEWYVRRGTEQSGPITKQEFEVLLKHLQQSDLVKRSDWLEWRPFKSALVAAGDATLVDGEVVERLTPQTLFRTLLDRDLRGRGIATERHRQYQYTRVVEEL